MTRALLILLAVLLLGALAYACGLSPLYGLIALLGYRHKVSPDPADAEKKANVANKAKEAVTVKAANDRANQELKTDALADLNARLKKRGGP